MASPLQMDPLWLLFGSIVAGGVISLFCWTGWSSYKYKSLPGKSSLVSAFASGAMVFGLSVYAYVFNTDENPVKTATDFITKATYVITSVTNPEIATTVAAATASSELQTGIPPF